MTTATTTTATTTIASCLTSACRKRKRSSDSHVRFSTQPQSIIYTHSQSDYDRSGLLPDIQPHQHEKQKFILALAINFVHRATTTLPPLPSSLPLKAMQHTPTALGKKPTANPCSNRPKLSIDTSNLRGPLYFTNMTTNHQKKTKLSGAEDEKDDFDSVTKENTRRNSLPLVL